MSQSTAAEKITVPKLFKMRQNGEKITMITAYDFTMARLADEAGADMILVGDSLGMVIQGERDTLGVSIEDLIYHTGCVARGVSRAHVMADMPFMSYQVCHEEGVKNAGLLLKAGAESVKIEGGEEMADFVWYMNKIGIPVMAHVGLKPQSIHVMGGYKVQGKTRKEAEIIIEDAKIMEEAGAFSLLLEGIPLEVAEQVTRSVQIPTIGIGSGPHCNGQVLVCTDILGANPDFKPRFVKRYADFHEIATRAFSEYIAEVKSGAFPGEEHSVHRDLVAVKAEEKK
ncbi:MAG: 3-methyl-2-oxobutanoate hydroxymethyltransferase [Deltaproteobacteria bacterium]|nr:3-methyl-2-oxobutanoate hydroxymethyltransferase [Deltaproteobacteria bacterium]